MKRKLDYIKTNTNRKVKSFTVIHIFDFSRDTTTQTKEDNYTNVEQPSVFLAGLRGGGMSEPTVMTKMDLTVDVEGRQLAPSKRK